MSVLVAAANRNYIFCFKAPNSSQVIICFYHRGITNCCLESFQKNKKTQKEQNGEK